MTPFPNRSHVEVPGRTWLCGEHYLTQYHDPEWQVPLGFWEKKKENNEENVIIPCLILLLKLQREPYSSNNWHRSKSLSSMWKVFMSYLSLYPLYFFEQTEDGWLIFIELNLIRLNWIWKQKTTVFLGFKQKKGKKNLSLVYPSKINK